MIDREKPLDVCKIEARSLVQHKVKHDNVSIDKALKAISKEADIPLGTLKRWIYPNGQESFNNKRRKKKVVSHVIQDSCITDNGDTNGDTSDTNGDTNSIVITDIGLVKDICSTAKIIGISVEDTIRLGMDMFKRQ